MHALAGLDPGVHLVVVGGGDRKRFAMVAEGAGVGGRVHFLGPTEKPAWFYAAADVFVLPTRQEPWSSTLIEAMAAGVPIVTTKVAGAAEAVEEAGAGIVLRADSPRELRAAVAALIDDPSWRSEMGNRGRAAAYRFSPEAHAAAVLLVYEKALRSRAA